MLRMTLWLWVNYLLQGRKEVNNLNKVIAVFILVFYSSAVFAQSIPAGSTLDATAITQHLEGIDSIDSRSVDLAMSSADYMVTAGDIYTLSFAAGGTPVSYTIPVDTSYRVRVANLAVLDASGMSFVKLKRQVEDIVTKNYPLSAVQFVLLNPSTFNVRLVGEVEQSREIQAWALTRLSAVLGYGLTSYASNRIVTVTSQSGQKKTYDLFQARRFGDLTQNPYLRPGDVITIERAERIVNINGAVERPGRYELLAGENFKELIEYYANGYTRYADPSRIEVSRTYGFNSNQKKEEILYWDGTNLEENRELIDNDVVTVPSYTSLRSVIFVEGAISTPETIESTKSGGNVSIVETASGMPDASGRMAFLFVEGRSYTSFIRSIVNLFTPISDTDKAYVMRKGTIIPIDVTRIMHDVEYNPDLLMEPYDVLHIPFQSFKVRVSGSVKNPGQYPYVPNRTYEYYISLAGGFITSENVGGSVTITDVEGKRMNKRDVITPDSTIIAKTNSFMYWWNQYAPIITTVGTVLTAVGAGVTIWQAFN